LEEGVQGKQQRQWEIEEVGMESLRRGRGERDWKPGRGKTSNFSNLLHLILIEF
jgi:hypothetical protein